MGSDHDKSFLLLFFKKEALACFVDPATGGAIQALTYAGTPLLRPVADPRLTAQQGRAVAAYPLIPYANRIAWGRFAWQGRETQLARNFGDHPHPIHGNAWMHPWTVEARSQATATLSFTHAPRGRDDPEWPFAYRAEQRFAVSEAGLAIDLRVQNTDAVAWPAGLGLHPYVARGAATTLAFAARSCWRTGADGLPAARVPPPVDFSRARRLDGPAFDACFNGWTGQATVDLADAGLRLHLQAGPARHLQLYTPQDQDYFGLEPVTNMPDAINRMAQEEDAGLAVLAPGESLAMNVQFGIEATARVVSRS